MNMKKYKGAVFFDIDGTLIDERIGVSRPTESTREAIERLKKNGYLTGIATGRAKCYLCDLAVNFDCYITCNGAVVELGGETVYADHIDTARQTELIRYLDENGFGYAFETLEYCYYGGDRRDAFLRVVEESNLNRACFVPMEDPTIKTFKAMISFDSEDQLAALRARFGQEFDIAQHHHDPEADVNRFGVSKATGIKKAIELAGIGIESIYAFGDGANDVDMFCAVGCGIAMTPHSPLLGPYAKMIAGGVADGGIFRALREIGLI